MRIVKFESSVSLFLPCYNEENNINNIVRKSLYILERITKEFEVIVVDDGSIDGTGKILEKLAKQENKIKLVKHHKNLGYGAALKSGIKASSKQIIAFIDSDGQFEISEIERFLPLLNTHPIVIGFRNPRMDPIHRKINAYLFNKLVQFLFDLKIIDLNCAFKFFRREVFEIVKLKSNGAFINTEILIRAKNAGFSIAEIGVTHYPRKSGVPTGAKSYVIFKAFKELFQLYKELKQ